VEQNGYLGQECVLALRRSAVRTFLVDKVLKV